MSNSEEIGELIAQCPFGIEKRFCPNQETLAKDIIAAIQGDLIFICKLKGGTKDCPEFKADMNYWRRMYNEVSQMWKSKNQAYKCNR